MDRDRLKRDVERIEKHREEKAAVAKSEREIFAALKSDGFNCKVVREILKRRGMDDSDGWDAEVATYEAAVRGLREAAEAVRGGATYEEAATTHHVRKADLHHFVQATDSVPDTHIPEHDPETGEIDQPTPSIIEGAEQLRELYEAPVAEPEPPSHGGTPNSTPPPGSAHEGDDDGRTRGATRDQSGGAARGLQAACGSDSLGAGDDELSERQDRPADRAAGQGAGGGSGEVDRSLADRAGRKESETLATVSLGAVASHSDGERGASSDSSDDLAFPIFLDRRSALRAQDGAPPHRGKTRDELVQ